MPMRMILGGLLALLVSGCTLPLSQSGGTLSPENQILPTPTSVFHPFFDAHKIMEGICFEAGFDAAGRVFVLRNPDELIEFFDLADNSRLCRHPVGRRHFDFDTGHVLAGGWSRGMGCVASHEIIRVQRDDEAKMLTIDLDFTVEGICNYELVRPFWLSIDQAADYSITIKVIHAVG